MAIFAVYSIVQLAPLAFLAAVLYYAYWQLTVGSARRRLIKTYGCRPPNRVVNTFLGSIFSRKLVRQISSAHGARKLREVTQQRYLDFGYTHLGKIYHLDWLYTVEAENVQTILSTNFKDYELPARRKSAFLPLLGRGT